MKTEIVKREGGSAWTKKASEVKGRKGKIQLGY